MSDEQDKPTLTRKPLGLKRTVEAGQVQQQFSHGRRNTVVVEVKPQAEFDAWLAAQKAARQAALAPAAQTAALAPTNDPATTLRVASAE